MEDYPKIDIKEIIDAAKFVDIVTEYRKRDIIELDQLQQMAAYTAGFRKVTKTVTASALISPNILNYDADTSAGALTLTLPANPIDGQEFRIFKKDSSGGAITIDGNGKNINGTSTISFNTHNQGRLIIYMGGSGEWRAATL